MSKKPRVRSSKNGRSKTASSRRKISSPQKLTEHSSTGNGNGVHAYLSEPGVGDFQELLRVLIQIRDGNLSVRMPIDREGVHGKICDTLNEIISRNQIFIEEVVHAREIIGRKGKLTHRIHIPNGRGSWATGVGALNMLISDLVHPTAEIARVISSVAQGNLSQQMPLEIGGHKLRGEFAKIAKEVNSMVKQLSQFSLEVTRVVREVGSEGKLGGQAKVKGVGGVWRDLTDSVNQMASNLTGQVRNIAEVTTAVAKGDLSKKITEDVKGEILELKNTINTMVDQLNSFSSEVTRVALEVGTEGKLGGQAQVKGVAGTWKDLTDSVNQMASNLTGQVRNIAEVTTAVAKGDLSRQITVDVKGEILELKNTINTMVDQLNSFSSEVTRVALEVGSEGKLGGQATVKGAGGVWKDLTDSVNQMASNLTGQVRNIAQVTTAVAKGDLSHKITVDVRGEIRELKDTINTMVDQLNSFASEVTRVAREVGSEGKLGGQATVIGAAGVWKDLTDSVNQMANNLTSQVRNIAQVTTAVAKGNLSHKITVDVKGEILELKNTMNTMVDQLNSFASEVTRVAREVGSEGKLGGQADVPGVAGTWKDLTDSVNQMTGNLTAQVRNIAQVTKAVAGGDLSKTVTIDVKGEILDLKNTINTMVEQLNSFAFEVTRVAREVGTEGKLGGQAEVYGVAGTWKDLTDSVNMMASNLTSQVRGIAKVVTSVATGNLRQKLVINAKGEVAQLTDTINEMIETLAVFADQVTNVAREVGVDGRLGGQASVPGASGIWKDLTENVNQLAQNLTTQVRSIAEVASAVTKGDLTRTIRVEAKGEVESLKDTINQMIANLRATTLRNQEQDWLKSNLAKFTQMLQGQRDLDTVCNRVLSELAQVVFAQYGAFYILKYDDDVLAEPKLRLFASYAQQRTRNLPREFGIGEGLVGQCAREKGRILLTKVPRGYINISSGLGKINPSNLVILPVLFENNVKAVIELASLQPFTESHLDFLGQVTESIGIVLNNIEANNRTEKLLMQSQSLANELKIQQEELRRTNDELQDKAQLLAKQKEEVEAKNKEVEEARSSLEEKAEQLTLTSKYKSEFLANMSHELRTPLNSLLILAQQLYENTEGNLSEKQIRYAKTIHSCGDDLIQLINDILDLSKIESGFISANISSIALEEIARFVETTFKPIAEARNLGFDIRLAPDLPAYINSDIQRLNQILKNLLSNAFKFTEKGEVSLSVYHANRFPKDADPDSDERVRIIAFSISDTGIGITPEKQQIIFEAFQQAEGSTSRKYGGTGLGLSISRGLAELLGGAIELESEPGKGSTFTFYHPLSELPAVAALENGKGARSPYERIPNADDFDNLLNNLLVSTEGIEAARRTDVVSEMINQTGDDRSNIVSGDRVVLVVEDDFRFGKIIIDYAHDLRLKVAIATNYLEVFDFIGRFSPIAVTLDIKLSTTSGWKVLDLLRSDLNYRHIPVYVISGEENRQLALQRGARDFLLKPLTNDALKELFTDIIDFSTRPARRVLVVEDNDLESSQIARALQDPTIEVKVASTGNRAFELLQTEEPDCIVLDYALPDVSGTDLISNVTRLKKKLTPVILYTARDFRSPETASLSTSVTGIIQKSVDSVERLLEETLAHLHVPHKHLSEDKRRIVEGIRNKTDVLNGRAILVVDDDVRNLFALTSVFERYNMNVTTAESGREAIAVLGTNPRIEMVLMDIMMPEMDGYETIQKIRREHKNSTLPVIAVTAKAMKGDRQKCLEAGASDYITKPLRIDQLLALMRLWFYKG